MVRVLVMMLAMAIYWGNADEKMKVAVIVVPLVWVTSGDTRIRMWRPTS